MDAFKPILNCLEQSPAILKDLIDKIPRNITKNQRIPGKWSIHEHACHLADVQLMLIKRFEIFRDQQPPEFNPYLPGNTVSDHHLMQMELEYSLEQFSKTRERLIDLVKTLEPSVWEKTASHPEYSEYTPMILLRHILMHDHFHMYRIEQLWLTNDEYL